MTNVTQNKVNNNESQKVEKPKVMTIASVFQKHASVGAKDRKSLATKILSDFKANGITKNIRGHVITETRVSQQISAMLRDIKMERGKDKKSWWSIYSIVEDADIIKIVKK